MERNQEFTKSLNKEKKIQLEELLQKEGSKSKFRSKIQMTFLYIIASAIILISLLVTSYLITNDNKFYYLPIIVCTILSASIYILYFWRWLKDFNVIKDYVQSHWSKLYKWVIYLTLTSFLISFICTIIALAIQHAGYIAFSHPEFSSNGTIQSGGFYLYYSILIGIIFDILLPFIAVSIDTYVIYHLEIDLQKIVSEYDENQIDYLKQKIKEEVEKVKIENSDSQNNSDITIESKNNSFIEEQKPLSQEEIDDLLKQNSLFNDLDKEKESDDNDEQSK